MHLSTANHALSHQQWPMLFIISLSKWQPWLEINCISCYVLSCSGVNPHLKRQCKKKKKKNPEAHHGILFTFNSTLSNSGSLNWMGFLSERIGRAGWSPVGPDMWWYIEQQSLGTCINWSDAPCKKPCSLSVIKVNGAEASSRSARLASPQAC